MQMTKLRVIIIIIPSTFFRFEQPQQR